MGVADRQGQGIGGIIRFGDLFQPEYGTGHLHHLGFDRFAVRGPVIPVDCTDFAQVDYKEIARKIKEVLG